MKQSELVELYARVRLGLLISVPVAMWGFTYWLSDGEMLPAILFGIAVLFPLIDTLPGKAEVQHRLIAERKQRDTMWFRMI